jgi:hypothetical protein
VLGATSTNAQQGNNARPPSITKSFANSLNATGGRLLTPKSNTQYLRSQLVDTGTTSLPPSRDIVTNFGSDDGDASGDRQNGK